MNWYRIGYVFPLLLVAMLFITTGHPQSALSAGTGIPVTGYAWSDTVGWIDLNCSNSNTCATNNFGLAIASDGTFSGYAWSDNIGWVSANAADVAGCPSSPCTPKVSGSAVTGWLKAIGAGGEGWDGWISLSGSGYGPTLLNGVFSGFSWGSAVVGWVDWSLARSTYSPCLAHYSCSGNDLHHTDAFCADTFVQTCTYQCSVNGCVTPPPPSFNSGANTSGHLQAIPSLVSSGSATKIYWNISNISSCSIDGNGDHWTGGSSGISGKVSSPITQRTVYTLSCTGLDNSHIQESATVNISPIYQEL